MLHILTISQRVRFPVPETTCTQSPFFGIFWGVESANLRLRGLGYFCSFGSWAVVRHSGTLGRRCYNFLGLYQKTCRFLFCVCLNECSYSPALCDFDGGEPLVLSSIGLKIHCSKSLRFNVRSQFRSPSPANSAPPLLQ